MTNREQILRVFTIGDLENPITYQSITLKMEQADEQDEANKDFQIAELEDNAKVEEIPDVSNEDDEMRKKGIKEAF